MIKNETTMISIMHTFTCKKTLFFETRVLRFLFFFLYQITKYNILQCIESSDKNYDTEFCTKLVKNRSNLIKNYPETAQLYRPVIGEAN